MAHYDEFVENEKINAQRAEIERLQAEYLELAGRSQNWNTHIELQNIQLADLQREKAELLEVLSGCTGDLAAYAFSEYGHDAKLYNGIVSLQAWLAAAEADRDVFLAALTETRAGVIAIGRSLANVIGTARVMHIKQAKADAIEAAKTGVQT